MHQQYQSQHLSTISKPGKKFKKVLNTKNETGLLAKDILANTKVEVSLGDFCCKSPAFHSKMHVAISDTQKKQNQEVMLTGYDAPRVNSALEGVPTKVILDSGAYANIVSIHFLETIGIEEISTCSQKYILADGSIAPCLGVVDSLQLEIEGVAIHISAAVFDHCQYNLLLGQETLKDLKITTQ
ncbi:hypothetical protein DSO57_1038547 [Entomophthora muscae]|uniref:Uncharacterized protein n=1 Tax=Entomophthora muscae TaxID=34485 RepID=A0ACC2TY58_9FUNG|nr:hypothetical protein DSO57_1038547 [Entomophthora muscae]